MILRSLVAYIVVCSERSTHDDHDGGGTFKALGLLHGSYGNDVVGAGGAGKRLGRHASGVDAAEDQDNVIEGVP